MPTELEKNVENAMVEVRGLIKELQDQQRRYHILCSNNKKLHDYRARLNEGVMVHSPCPPEACQLSPSEVMELKKSCSRGVGSGGSKQSPRNVPTPDLDHSPEHTAQLEALMSEFAGDGSRSMTENRTDSLSSLGVSHEQDMRSHHSAATSNLRGGRRRGHVMQNTQHRPASAPGDSMHHHSLSHPYAPARPMQHGGRPGPAPGEWLAGPGSANMHGTSMHRNMGTGPRHSPAPVAQGARIQVEGNSRSRGPPRSAPKAVLDLWHGHGTQLLHDHHQPFSGMLPVVSVSEDHIYPSGLGAKVLDLGGEDMDHLGLSGIDHHCPEDMLIEGDDAMELLGHEHHEKVPLFGSSTNMDVVWERYVGLGDALLYDTYDDEFAI